MFKEENFHLKKQCQITDPTCWQNELGRQLNCDKNDLECWGNLSKKLPCQIDNIQCWKEQYPDIPCNFHDKTCWQKLLPNLPCSINDKQCWNRIENKGNKMRQMGIRNSLLVDGMNDSGFTNLYQLPMSKAYVNEIFGMI